MDRQHKIIAIVLDPKCLLDMGPEMRSLLTTGGNSLLYATAANTAAGAAQQPQQQLVQLADSSSSSWSSSGGQGPANNQATSMDEIQPQAHQLVATLTRQSGGNQQVSTQAMQLATSRITFINYNEPKFWSRLKQLMPVARPSVAPVALTLTTKN